MSFDDIMFSSLQVQTSQSHGSDSVHFDMRMSRRRLTEVQSQRQKGRKKENVSDFEHDEYGCQCQMSCSSECFTNCWSPGIFTISQPSQGSIENASQKIKYPVKLSSEEKCHVNAGWMVLNLLICHNYIRFPFKSICASGFQSRENNMDVTDGRTNKGKLGFSVHTVHFLISATLLNNNPRNTPKQHTKIRNFWGFFSSS